MRKRLGLLVPTVLRGFALLALVAPLAGSPLPAQSGGRIEGDVVEVGSLRPIAGALVRVLGTQTDPLGKYSLEDVPFGEVQLRVEALGYATVVHSGRVRPNRLALIHFRLARIATVLDQLVVRSERHGGRRAGVSTGIVEANDIEREPGLRTPEILVARVPGAQVFWSGGEVGAVSRVLLRGVKFPRRTGRGRQDRRMFRARSGKPTPLASNQAGRALHH